jgi:hypothetical protein
MYSSFPLICNIHDCIMLLHISILVGMMIHSHVVVISKLF